MPGALDQIRVLDFTAVVSGPYGTRLLADCGAEVVKVEPPTGDMTRVVPPVFDDGSRYFSAFNCGKKSIVLDLKDPADVATAGKLARSCDVLVENFRPGVMARLGLDYATVRRDNERVVYASLSGFGQSGPLARNPAYGPIVQAMSGYEQAQMSYQVEERAEVPSFIGVQVADLVSGIFTFSAIQTALLNRERNGHGDYVDVSLFDSILALTTAELQFAQVGYEPASTFRPIAVQDGFLMVAPVSPKNRQGICDLLTEEGAPQAFPASGPEMLTLIDALAAWCTDRSAADCIARLSAHGVPCAKYRSPADVLEDPNVRAQGTFAELDSPGTPFLVNNAPFRFEVADSGVQGRAPGLGEHQEEILNRWLS